MAAANGFVTVSPDTRYGDQTGSFANTEIWAAKYTAPGSGTLTITEIGLWCNGTGIDCHIAIFTHDAANDCPDTMVANSDTGLLDVPGSLSKLSHTYVTQPTITGGQTYWLCMTQDGTLTYSRFASGGTGVYKTGQTYPTYPTGDAWHTHTDWNKDYSLYAVYQAAATGTNVPQMMMYYARIRNTSGD